jgi:hypothetical protein
VFVCYRYRDQVICHRAFLVLYDVKAGQLGTIQRHYLKHGPVPRRHGNRGRSPHNKYEFSVVEEAARFITTYALIHGLPYPAPLRGKDGLPPVLLPPKDTKASVHKQYTESATSGGLQSLGLTVFQDLWRSVCPHIKVSPLRSDVCPTCERLSSSVSSAIGDANKQTAISAFQAHINHATEERGEYNRCVELAEVEAKQYCTRLQEAGLPTPVPGTLPPCSNDRRHPHYTFDYSQAVLIPHHFRQVGPLYFLNPRKIQLFGVRVEGSPVQLNYLLDEDQTIGMDGAGSKGPNGVLSMLDNALSRQGLGEVECHLHADNCAGGSSS